MKMSDNYEFAFFSFIVKYGEWWVDLARIDIPCFNGALFGIAFQYGEMDYFDVLYLGQFIWHKKEKEE